MILDYQHAQDKVQELLETGQINEETYRDMLADIYMWEKDCEYELVKEDKWVLKLIPLMSMSY